MSRDLENALMRITKAGARIDFPADTEERQLVWPEECPFTEGELRDELRSLVEDVKALREKVEKLHRRLPVPAEDELDDDIPDSIYGALYGCVVVFSDCRIDEAEKEIEDALVATPESLRADYLACELRDAASDAFRHLFPGLREKAGRRGKEFLDREAARRAERARSSDE